MGVQGVNESIGRLRHTSLALRLSGVDLMNAVYFSSFVDCDRSRVNIIVTCQ